MATFTREELLHLRDSPLVTSSIPDLPPWISSEAIEKAQKEPRVSGRVLTTADGAAADNDGFILRESTRNKRDKESRNSTADRLFERRNPLSKEDRGFDKNDVFKSLREPRRPDSGEEGFSAARRGLKKGAGGKEGTGRDPAWATERKQGSSHASSAATAAAAAAMTGSHHHTGRDEEDDPTGKTADDFERWKASMRKAEGLEAGAQVSETVLPPLPLANAAGEAASTASPLKAPPGLTQAMASKTDGETLMSQLTAASRPAAGKPSTTTATQPQQPASGSISGSSKFSKFFSSSQPSSISRADTKASSQQQQQGYAPSETHARVESGDQRAPKNKDDVEGLERILAMLSSSQSAVPMSMPQQQQQRPPPQQQQQQQQQQQAYGQVPGDVYATRGNNPSQPLRGHGGGNTFPASATGPAHFPQYGERVQPPGFYGQGPGVMAAQGNSHPASPHQDRAWVAFPPQQQQQQDFDAHRLHGPPPGVGYQTMPHGGRHGLHGLHPGAGPMGLPAMRDGTTGADSILGHHAQNQDFFSSLLSQAGQGSMAPSAHQQQQQQQHRMAGGPASPVRHMAAQAGQGQGRLPPSREEMAFIQQQQQQQQRMQGRYESGPMSGAQPGGGPQQAWSLDPRPLPPGPPRPYR